MRISLNETHDPTLRSWVPSANGHPDFPIQNLPFGIVQPAGLPSRGGMAIGDFILDLEYLSRSGLLSGESQAACEVCAAETLNAFLALDPDVHSSLRRDVSRLLSEESAPRADLLHRAQDCTLQLPASIGDYTDFYAGIHHAYNVGRLLRPEQPLMSNYKWVPIGYHGRASSVRVSGEGVRRPNGQHKLSDQREPGFGPTNRLDYEMELGMWIGRGNELGEPLNIGEAAGSIAGFCLLNDWSARDVQAWEYQPLGPFLAKSFHTTISPWIITPEALVPFRAAQRARAQSDPQPLPYLFDPKDQGEGALDLELNVFITSAKMRSLGIAPHRLSRGNALHMYWTPSQLVAHHTSNGCNLRTGDLIGTGTLSAPSTQGWGSLLEITAGGARSIDLPSGETRTFLQDGDEIQISAQAVRSGFVSIGFGPCTGTILPPPLATAASQKDTRQA